MSRAKTNIGVCDSSHWLDALLSCEAMIARDEEFWIHWFSERGGQLHAKSLFRVATEEDALICVDRMPVGIVGGVAFQVPRDRADGTYGEASVLAMRGDVPGDFLTRVRSTLIG